MTGRRPACCPRQLFFFALLLTTWSPFGNRSLRSPHSQNVGRVGTVGESGESVKSGDCGITSPQVRYRSLRQQALAWQRYTALYTNLEKRQGERQQDALGLRALRWAFGRAASDGGSRPGRPPGRPPDASRLKARVVAWIGVSFCQRHP